MPPRKSALPRKSPAPLIQSIHDLKVTLNDVEPKVWRRVSVPSDYTLADLHDVLQLAMGWTNSHLHQFMSGDDRYLPPDPEDMMEDTHPSVDSAAVRLSLVLPHSGSQLTYEYDFGDGWEHQIEVEAIRPVREGEYLPRCSAGARACPPEDCGGCSGYETFLRAIKDPDDPEHEEMLSWCGGGFDAEVFDMEAVNRLLTTYASRRRTWLGRVSSTKPSRRVYRTQRIDLLAAILEARDRQRNRRQDAAVRRNARGWVLAGSP